MHSSSLISVEGHSNFRRDSRTNAIINTNSSDYEKYISERENKKNLEETVKNTVKELSELKSEIGEIKEMLLKIIS